MAAPVWDSNSASDSNPYYSSPRELIHKRTFNPKSYYSKPYDHRLEQLCAAAKEYRGTSFEAFAFTIDISPPSDHWPQSFNDRSKIERGFRSYVFSSVGHGSQRMRVRIVKGPGAPDIKVRMCKDGGWKPFHTYLSSLPIYFGDRFNDVQHRIDHQRNWWLSNGKTLPFLSLPGEIRNAVYDVAFGPAAVPFPRHRIRKGYDFRLKPNTALLWVNKQIYVEAKHVLYSQTPFLFQHARLLNLLISSPRFPILQVRHIELAFDHRSFLRFFGSALVAFNEEGHKHIVPACGAEALRKMRLNSLTLVMPCPQSMMHTPWLDGGCQKVYVDCVLEAGWRFIKGHPVVIRGYVKTAQKEHWEKKIRAALEEQQFWEKTLGMSRDDGLVRWSAADNDDEEGGVRLDGALEDPVQEERAEELLPLRDCFCAKDCQELPWDPEDDE
ncbi:hypothetical protein H2203_003525 [Taxawa tesnikishii (nom. ined.)]|nr:hypothetical protein H2203_003525 [Dothideales sp. JES 119]